MSLPTQTELLQGGYFLNGQPFANIDANSTVDSLHNGYFLNGAPFAVVALDTVFPAYRFLIVF